MRASSSGSATIQDWTSSTPLPSTPTVTGIELVADWTDLVDWTQAAGLIDPDLAQQCRAATQRRSRSVLTWFRRLRSCLRTVLETGDDEAAAANALDAAVATVAVRLSYQPGQQRDIVPRRPNRAARATAAGARNRGARRNPPRPVTSPPLRRARTVCCSTTTPPRTARGDGATWQAAETEPRPKRTTVERDAERRPTWSTHLTLHPNPPTPSRGPRMATPKSMRATVSTAEGRQLGAPIRFHDGPDTRPALVAPTAEERGRSPSRRATMVR